MITIWTFGMMKGRRETEKEKKTIQARASKTCKVMIKRVKMETAVIIEMDLE